MSIYNKKGPLKVIAIITLWYFLFNIFACDIARAAGNPGSSGSSLLGIDSMLDDMHAKADAETVKALLVKYIEAEESNQALRLFIFRENGRLKEIVRLNPDRRNVEDAIEISAVLDEDGNLRIKKPAIGRILENVSRLEDCQYTRFGPNERYEVLLGSISIGDPEEPITVSVKTTEGEDIVDISGEKLTNVNGIVTVDREGNYTIVVKNASPHTLMHELSAFLSIFTDIDTHESDLLEAMSQVTSNHEFSSISGPALAREYTATLDVVRNTRTLPLPGELQRVQKSLLPGQHLVVAAEEGDADNKETRKIQRLRKLISAELPKLKDSLTAQKLADLLELRARSLNQKEVRKILGRKSQVTKRERSNIIKIVRQVQKERGLWFQNRLNRRTSLFLIFIVLPVSLIYYLFFYKNESRAPKTVYQDEWTETRNKIRAEKSDLNQKLIRQFLAAYPEEKDFVDEINSNQGVVFANYVAEVYGHMMNGRESSWKSQIIVDELRSLPQRVLEARSPPGTLDHVNEILCDKRMVSLVEKIMQSSNIRQPDKGLSDFDKIAIDCLALKIATFTLDAIYLRRERGGGSRQLAYYQKPKSPASAFACAYVDLASGTNFEQYLQDILNSPKRPIILTDVSPYVIHYWHTLSRVLELPNIQILDLDIKKISKETIPQKVGTIRLQNVAPWVPDLSEEWAEQVCDLVEPGGQIIFVQPLANLMGKGWKSPQLMEPTELMKTVTGEDLFNAKLMINFLQVIKKQEGRWKMLVGHVGGDGYFNQNQSGYITRPVQGMAPETAEVGFLLGGGAVGSAHSNVRSRERNA